MYEKYERFRHHVLSLLETRQVFQMLKVAQKVHVYIYVHLLVFIILKVIFLT